MIPMITGSELGEMWRSHELGCILAEVFGGPLDERGRDLIASIEGLL